MKNRLPKTERYTLGQEEFQFYITVELCIAIPEMQHMPKSLSHMRVHIIEPIITSLLNPMQKLNNASFIILHQGA